eukprot:gene12006-12150_t
MARKPSYVLPPDLLLRVLSLLNQADVPAVRLTCTHFAQVAAHFITSIQVRASLGCTTSNLTRLTSTTQLELTVSPPVQWQLLEHFVRQLPQLNDLRCTSKRLVKVNRPSIPLTILSHLTRITRLDLSQASQSHVLGSAARLAGAQLPALRAACFHDIDDLSVVALLAPNLQQLYCTSLSLDVAKLPQTAVLPHCTHFGADAVYTTATAKGIGADAAAAAAADGFAAAFPALQTLSEMPEITYTARTLHIVPVGAALTPLQQSLTALRMRGCKPFMEHLTLQLQPLHHLQRLCLYLIDPQLISSLLGLAAHVPQLRHLMLTFLRKPSTGLLEMAGGSA